MKNVEKGKNKHQQNETQDNSKNEKHKVFYDKNLKNRKFSNFGQTTFSSSPKPSFYDEIKLSLPYSSIGM
jgi:hypothetical protein